MKKRCPKCKTNRHQSCFGIRGDGYASWCRDCTNKKIKKWRDKNIDRVRELSKLYQKNNIFNTIRKNMKKTCFKRGWPKPPLIKDLESLWEKQDGVCYWTGMKMDKVHGFRKNPKAVSADRIDGDKPYTLDNIVLCCFWANLGRSETPANKWKQFMLELGLKGLWNKSKSFLKK